MTPLDKFSTAIDAFDEYNLNDPNREIFEGKSYPKEILYAKRMTERLARFAPNANEAVQLAARCQHIGRWEILRSSYPQNKKGYLLWRAEEKMHHAQLAEKILRECGYDDQTIESVKFLVLKKELKTNADTQLLEDVICLVFIEYYLEEFAAKHPTEKVIDIIQKTIKKMSPLAIAAAHQLPISANTQSLLQQALATPMLFHFEEVFMANDIRCIPMAVRFKLDGCGIKLKLSEWNQFSVAERTELSLYPTPDEEQLINYKKRVQQLVFDHTGKEATTMQVEPKPAWAELEKIHEALLNKLKEYHWTISVSQWKALSDLQRFALTKLSRPSHENKNFAKAMKEFGLGEGI